LRIPPIVNFFFFDFRIFCIQTEAVVRSPCLIYSRIFRSFAFDAGQANPAGQGTTSKRRFICLPVFIAGRFFGWLVHILFYLSYWEADGGGFVLVYPSFAFAARAFVYVRFFEVSKLV
jgi:hypothetical protein